MRFTYKTYHISIIIIRKIIFYMTCKGIYINAIDELLTQSKNPRSTIFKLYSLQ